MAARSIASLSLSFGLVNIPVKLYTATESKATIRFNLLDRQGGRLKQQYVSEQTGEVVERSEMVKGYEFDKDQFVLFSPEELKALDQAASHVVEIVAFVPTASVDPIYFDKAYFLAPDKRGGKPYSLLMEAMRETGHCGIAQWSSKGREHVVQIRPGEGGIVMQQLLYAEEVRSMDELGIERVDVTAAELTLAKQLIAQITQDGYDAQAFVDHERARVLAAIDAKIAGQQIVASSRGEEPAGGQVIDLMEALRASLAKPTGKAAAAPAAAKKARAAAAPAAPAPAPAVTKLKDRQPLRRAAAPVAPAEEAAPAPARSRARK
jgi:DNA end-binding protein Ku